MRRVKKTTHKKNRIADSVVIGFIVSGTCGLLSGLPGMQWIAWGAVIGILPFCCAAMAAFLGRLFDLIDS